MPMSTPLIIKVCFCHLLNFNVLQAKQLRLRQLFFKQATGYVTSLLPHLFSGIDNDKTLHAADLRLRQLSWQLS